MTSARPSRPAPDAAAGALPGAYWRRTDWQRPWLAPYCAKAAAVVGLLEQGLSCAEALNAQLAQAPQHLAAGELQFVPQSDLPAGQAYESFIHANAAVPTRNNVHDLFNGLVWLHFPALKRWLNERQAEVLRQTGVAAARGAARDALTLFDENAALWAAPAAAAQSLVQRDWARLFGPQRALLRATPPLLFGHALLEKLTQPYKAITAHVWLLPAHETAATWQPPWPLARSWHALPVLGVPGWWCANEEPAFYADPAVFRACATAR